MRRLFIPLFLSFLVYAFHTPGEAESATTEAARLTIDRSEESPVQKNVSIEVGTVAAEEAGEWMMQETRSLMQSHPGISVFTFGLKEPTRSRLPLHEIPVLAANVIGIDSARGDEIPYLVSRGLIVPIDKFLPDPDFEIERIYPNLWDSVTYQGQRWGVPYMCRTLVLACDWELFEEARIDSPPETWEEFLDCAKRLTKGADSAGRPPQWGFRLGLRRTDKNLHLFALWITMILQKGGYVMKDGRFDLTHPALKEAYDFLHELKDRSGVALEDNRDLITVRRDRDVRFAMHLIKCGDIRFLGTRFRAVAETQRFQLVPLPTFGSPVSFKDKSLYLSIRKSTPEKERASWEFLKWISRPDISFPPKIEAVSVCCRDDYSQRNDFGRYATPSYGMNPWVAHTSKAMPRDHLDHIPGVSEASRHLKETFGDLMQGHLAFPEAMRKAEKECNDLLRNCTRGVSRYTLYE